MLPTVCSVLAIIGLGRFDTFPSMTFCTVYDVLLLVSIHRGFLLTYLTPYNHIKNVLSVSLNETFPSFPLDIMLLLKHLITQILCQESVDYLSFITRKCEPSKIMHFTP